MSPRRARPRSCGRSSCRTARPPRSCCSRARSSAPSSRPTSRSRRGPASRSSSTSSATSARRSRSSATRCATLMAREPTASCAVIARHPEQADAYFEGLRRAEVPALRRVAPRRVQLPARRRRHRRRAGEGPRVRLRRDGRRQRRRATPTSDWARHLLHIGVTRAAHQLWLVSTGEPSPLVPEALRDGGRMGVESTP